MRIKYTLLTALLIALPAALHAAESTKSKLPKVGTHHQAVLDLQPVGYWPSDQGEGTVLQDLSPNANHGVIHHVPWNAKTSLLNFSGAYQWLEIPAHEAYRTPAFSMGGWVFLRSEVVGSGWPNRQGMILIGNREWLAGSGVQLCIRAQEVIDVVSDGKEDVLGTRRFVSERDGKTIRKSEGKPNLALGQWHHLLYTFEPDKDLSAPSTPPNLSPGAAVTGTGSVYFNGALVATKEKIAYKSIAANLQIGNDAIWWHQQAGKSGSLDGSVRDMIWFDRALSADEVGRLHDAKPAAQPEVYGADRIVLHGQGIAATDLAGLDPNQRREALELFGNKDAAVLQPLAARLLPVLIASLDEPECRLPAVQVLGKLDDASSRDALRAAIPKLTALVQDSAKLEKERAEAALALAAIGRDATDAALALSALLENQVRQHGERVPRVEDLLRNALIRALLDIAPEDPAAKAAVGMALAKPLFAELDLGTPARDGVRRLAEAGRYFEALELFRKLPKKEQGGNYFSTKDGGQGGDYTATAHYNGVTYKVGTGVAWQGVEKIPVDEFESIVNELSQEYPAAKDWLPSDSPHLYRVPITKIDANGKEQKIYLEGKNFILEGSDEKCRAWSIFVDELGYVHLTGGQHNSPNSNYYIPGSWEKMGVSRDKENDQYPLQMYWVSSKPESIDSFEFAGRRNDPRAIPASYLNYMCVLQSLQNETYLYGRSEAFGFQCWGMFGYDATKKRWTPVGGDPAKVIASARQHDPQWLDYLHDSIKAKNKIPDAPSDNRSLVWAWQPPFYNFCRDLWGARFDRTGRMHVSMQIAGLDGYGYNRSTSVYAWSDDRGKTFHRADGTKVELPLTVNPAPEHDAEIALSRQWWNLWASLLNEAAYGVPLR